MSDHVEHASEQLGTQIATLVRELAVLGETRSTIASRAIDRLAVLRGKLADLVSTDDNESSPHDVETRMLEHDAQHGAMLRRLGSSSSAGRSTRRHCSRLGR